MSAAAKAKSRSREAAELANEIYKIEARLLDLSKKLSDGTTELAATVRLSIVKRELEAYVHGIRYALGDEDAMPPPA